MLTLLIAAAVLAACAALRWFLDRPERKDAAFWERPHPPDGPVERGRGLQPAS